MMKVLYILPLLAVLGLFPTIEAAAEQTIQERIDKLQAKINDIEEQISNADPVRQAAMVGLLLREGDLVRGS